MTIAPTSRAAAEAIAPHAPCLREQVFTFIEGQRTNGASIDEVHVATGIATATVCGRFDDLKKAGRIVPANIRRPTSSGSPAEVWVTPAFKVKLERKAITSHVAKLDDQGATRADILRVLTTIKSSDLDARLRECADLGLISQMAAVIRQGEYVNHITKRGLCALGLDPSDRFHVDRGQE